MKELIAKLHIRLISIGLALRNFFVKTEKYKKVEIRGPKRFREKIRSALQLIDEKVPKEFELIENNIKVITEHVFTCSHPSKTFPAASIGYKRWPVDPAEEIACCIAHETYHCFLFNEYLLRHPGAKSVSHHVYLGEKAERQCTTYAIFEVGKWLGIKGNLEKRFTSAMDSRWWDVPYWERI